VLEGSVIAVVAMAHGAATLYHALSGTPHGLYRWHNKKTPMEAFASIGIAVVTGYRTCPFL
jgi:hypothetical protein